MSEIFHNFANNAEMPKTLHMEIEISPEILQAKQRFSIIGNSSALIGAISRALQVAPIDLSVLINGESGAGKEFFPKIIHAYSPRKHNKYIAVNCGAIPEGTIDSELFGHEKGAFTGAISSRKGYFEEADGGTIFLDEVAELPLTTQARLLRVLESGEFIKVGSSTVQKTNIRVVAATNVDMRKAVADGRFREDLYYRLSTIYIAVPPLRDRGNDILLLTRKFSNDFAEKYRTPAVEFDESAKAALLSYRWPGNVRQLKNVIEQVSLFEAGKSVTADDIKYYLPEAGSDYAPAIQQVPLQHTYDKEREMIFKLIFDLKNSLSEMQEEIDSLKKQKRQEPIGSIKELQKEISSVLPVIYDKDMASGGVHRIYPEDNAIEEGNPTRTLEDTEKETIRKALERNDGKRKKTADELKISERTLYRKIKEYGLDNI